MGVDRSILGNVAWERRSGLASKRGFWKVLFSTPRFEPNQTRKKRFRAVRLVREGQSRNLCLCQDGPWLDTRYLVVTNGMHAAGKTREFKKKNG